MTPKAEAELLDEGRARIIWGESAESVRLWMRERCFDHSIIDDTLNDALAERAQHIRSRARELLTEGCKYLAGSLGLFAASLLLAHFIGLISGKLTAVFALGALYGIYKLAKGQYYYSVPLKVSGSLQDL